uniref:Tachykinin-like peptide-II n=1 Tax=Polistes lanio TaxID=91419 RepID=TLP2_POLLN|nr:RecName: Full=Tachykinin-like peptide-II; Short=PllTkP-II [Polistes lanio]
ASEPTALGLPRIFPGLM